MADARLARPVVPPLAITGCALSAIALMMLGVALTTWMSRRSPSGGGWR